MRKSLILVLFIFSITFVAGYVLACCKCWPLADDPEASQTPALIPETMVAPPQFR